ncbi:MAG: glycine--tRNA ligase subunit beta [Nitrospirae bacterium CG18_big_fil_WC_8_21_14_2_50_70_55]|nr:MAG: glycine--tRNA ligase subunit beta [Nitrospirae bacterium CG18_big_fil_WC_8_21_14_2_50_70_55]PIU78594.1 MAG: glycine--tRNA ligase subunit beta [Nitrospirae bacterium CG06_land_8_20_14_3_00_70_43]PIW82496.1 MAG: glycine--tRNA ligase subunit beta [Nitrospirae bacterium CG_4_8_14_3_um_filter_70_85]PIX82457.1 MAG: glycine--tRNA ligase subunit beta [Nitrospirae bacterium CG_4_10_14_3_um_filter_70_108]
MPVAELLLEIGCEELPAGYLAPAVRALADGVLELLAELHVPATGLTTYETPRRLAICLAEVAEVQATREVERRGPAVSVAYDAGGKLTRAGEGFLRSAGVAEAELIRIHGTKGDYLGARIREGGGATRALLAARLPEVIRTLSFPKAMRWGSGTWRFARPVHWILCLLGGAVVDFAVDGVAAGKFTYGHRFIAPAACEVSGLESYLASLREAAVEPEPGRRAATIQARAATLGDEAGGRVVVDASLLDEVTHLVEQPDCCLGRFDEAFLALPREVLVTSMAKNQRYFPVEATAGGPLLSCFVAVTNSHPAAAANVRAGNERVLRARLADARFFWDEDRKRPLISRLADLAGVTLHERLGSVRGRVARMEEIAVALATEVGGAEVEAVRRAVQLAKADLTSHMVVEFTSLQGVMGRYYAAHDGEQPAVCLAIEEHYRPRFAGDLLPASPLGRLVAVAERLDVVCGGFAVGLIPTGSQDPFGLRRAGLGLIQICLDAGWDIDLAPQVARNLELLAAEGVQVAASAAAQLRDFLGQRLHYALCSHGVAEEVVRAVLAAGATRPVDARARAAALAELRQDPSFADIATSFKRVNRILPDGFVGAAVDRAVLTEVAERELLAACEQVELLAAPLRAAGDYGQLLRRLVTLRPAVDRFFEDILVMAQEEAVRRARLSLLARVRHLFDGLADMSQLAAEG